MFEKHFIKILLLITIAGQSCKSSDGNTGNAERDNDQSDHVTLRIFFGSKGGFTGNVREFYLNNSGMLYKIKAKDTVELKEISQSKTQTLFDKLHAVCKKHESFQKPGNMSYFIKYVPKEEEAGKTFLWGSPQFTVPDKLQELYNQLETLTKK